MKDTWIWYIIATVLFIYSLYRLWQIVSYTLRRSASKMWTLTSGRVIEKRVTLRQFKMTGVGSSIPQITYVYSALGTEYKKKVSLGSRWGNKTAEDALGKVGDTVVVRYNPLKPEESFIDDEHLSTNDIWSVLVLWIIIFFFLYSFYASGILSLGSPTIP